MLFNFIKLFWTYFSGFRNIDVYLFAFLVLFVKMSDLSFNSFYNFLKSVCPDYKINIPHKPFHPNIINGDFFFFISEGSSLFSFVSNLLLVSYVLFIFHFYFFIFFKDSHFYKLYSFLEKELNSFDDLVFIFVLFSLIFVLSLFNIFNFIINFNFFLFVLNLFFLNIFLIFIFILFSLFNFGFNFIINLKGSASKQFFFYELVYDIINSFSFVLRFFIQLLRIIIVLVLFYTYHHVITIHYLTMVNNRSKDFDFSTFTSFVFYIFYLLFEYIHIFVLFLIQFCVFTIMFFWLFQFLFSSFFNKKLELSFN